MKIRRQYDNLKFILNPWWKYGKLLITGGLLSAIIISPIAGYFSATLAQAVIEKIQETNLFHDAILVGIIYLLIALSLNLIKFVFDDCYSHWKKQEIEGKIEKSIYEKALTVDYANLDDPKFLDSYKLATEKFAAQSSEALQNVFLLLTEVAKFVVYGYLIASRSVILLLIVVLCSVFTAYAQIFWSKVSVDRETVMVSERRKADYLRRLFYNHTAVADMRSCAIKRPLFNLFDESIENRISVFKKFALKEFVIDTLISVAQLGTIFAVPVYVAWGILSGNVDGIGAYATLIASSMSLKDTLNALGWWSSQISVGVAYADKVKKFFNVNSTIEKSTSGILPDEGAFSIFMNRVSYAYPNSDFSLRDINLSISPGQKIAIVGENGAGKTTLTKLLLRLYDVDSGSVLINGRSIDDYNISALRNKIGVAFQNSILYALSVRDNMTVYSECDDVRLEDNLHAIGLNINIHSQVSKEFDESGLVLSGGDAQRLCLSRLLHSEFGLLILDEPSSALDPIAEYNLAKLIFNNSPTTTIMVAHRLSTIVDADMIYLFSDGSIIESGTHSQLMRKHGKYAEMFEKQAEGYRRECDK